MSKKAKYELKYSTGSISGHGISLTVIENGYGYKLSPGKIIGFYQPQFKWQMTEDDLRTLIKELQKFLPVRKDKKRERRPKDQQ